MIRKHQVHRASFQVKVALAAVRGEGTPSELGLRFGVHPTQVSQWKHQLEKTAQRIFSGEATPSAREAELATTLERMQTELDWLKKKLPSSIQENRTWIEPDHRELSIRRQCELLGLDRSSWYRAPAKESAENLALMRLIDEQYLRTPFYGSRNMTFWLTQQGYAVNRKRVQRLMRTMGLEAIYPQRSTTRRCLEHRIYPYLLRDVAILRPNQVWSTDITYIPLARGYGYLTAVLDWYSRYVLSWELSRTLDGEFCLAVLEQALAVGSPEIFNTDQGSQFTSQAFTSQAFTSQAFTSQAFTGQAFTGRLERAGIAISMDGRGRALDNVFVERLWRSVKYEDVYLKEYPTWESLTAGLRSYFKFYCHERPHQSLGNRTPAAVYHGGK